MRPSNFQGNIHVINFPATTDAAELAALFDDFGLVMGAQIKTIDSNGSQMRLGIVSVAPDTAADKAIEALQGHLLGGQKLKLKKAKPPVKAERKPTAQRPDRERASPMMVERFPASAMPAPRKVIVEYRGRRARGPAL